MNDDENEERENRYAPTPTQSPKKKWKLSRGQKYFVICVIVFALIATVILTVFSYVNVPAGYKGVIVSAPNGSDIGKQLDEGWHFSPYYALCPIIQDCRSPNPMDSGHFSKGLFGRRSLLPTTFLFLNLFSVSTYFNSLLFISVWSLTLPMAIWSYKYIYFSTLLLCWF